MKNVEMAVAGNILTIEVDLSKGLGPSTSKKSIIIASTKANVGIPNREEKVVLTFTARSELIVFGGEFHPKACSNGQLAMN